MPNTLRKLRVFLCHASQDKSLVRELMQRLADEGWIDPWLDEKKLIPGEDWRTSIEEAVEQSDLVVICLSNHSVNKEGFVQKELRYAREIALEKPEGTIFLIPLRLEDCEVPRGLRFFQWTDYFGDKREQSYNELLESLSIRRQQVSRREDELARKIAEEQAKREEEQARKKLEQDELLRRLAAERAREDEEARAQKAALEQAKKEAFENAILEAKEKARLEAELKVLKETEKKTRQDGSIPNKSFLGSRFAAFRSSSYLAFVALLVLGLLMGIGVQGLGLLPLSATATPLESSTLPATSSPSPTNTDDPTTTPTLTLTVSLSQEPVAVFPTITITPIRTPTATGTPLPPSLRLARVGTYDFHFEVENVPSDCDPNICEIRWRAWEGGWIDNKPTSGPDLQSFDRLRYDSGWKRVSEITLQLDYSLPAIVPGKPYLVAFWLCLDAAKTNCKSGSGVIQN